MALNMMCSAQAGLFKYGLPGVALNGLSAATFSPAADKIYYYPIRCAEPINITKIAIGPQGEEPSELVLFSFYTCDYNLDPDGSPTPATPVEVVPDNGGLAGASVESDTVDIDLDRGTWLVGLQVTASVDLYTMLGTVPDTVGFGAVVGGTTRFNQVAYELSAAYTYDGTFPDPGSVADNAQVSDATNSPGFRYPFGLRYAIP